MKTDTPRTDGQVRKSGFAGAEKVPADFARTLERENTALRAQLAKPPAPMTWTEEDEARYRAKTLEGNWLDYADEPEVALP